jgi:hypothetical protein
LEGLGHDGREDVGRRHGDVLARGEGGRPRGWKVKAECGGEWYRWGVVLRWREDGEKRREKKRRRTREGLLTRPAGERDRGTRKQCLVVTFRQDYRKDHWEAAECADGKELMPTLSR